MNIDNFIRSVSMMYTAHDNGERRMATTEVLSAEGQMSPQEVLQTGVTLLRLITHGTAVQAYGAVLLKSGVVSGRLTADLVPYADIIAWYLTEPTLGRLLCKELVDLIAECMVYEWPDKFPNLIELVCPLKGDLAKHPRRVTLLCALVVKFMDPHLGRVPVRLMRKLKLSMVNCARGILVEVIQALFDIYTAAGGEESCCLDGDVSESVVDCLTIIVNLAPSLSVSEWWQLGLDNTMSVLVRWQPVAQEALVATASLFRCEVLSTATVDPKLSALLGAVLDRVGICVLERKYGMLEEIADLVLELPERIVQTVVNPVSRSCLALLEVPSIYIASIVCHILKRLGDAAFVNVNIMELMMRFAALVPKNVFHPEFGIDGEGKQLSKEQYGASRLFEQGFAEFRSLVGHLLISLVRIYPVVGNQFILHLLTNLCDGRGTEDDPRTPSGFVTQQSATFRAWEATQFLIEHLSESYKFSSEYVSQAIAVFVEKQTDDMVLFPVYLNMLSGFWSCRDDAALGVWEGTFSIIFACLERKSRIPHDIDFMSARKRALTLLVNACSQHSKRLACFTDSIMKRLEYLLMVPGTTQYERTLLYEAMSALTGALPDEEAQRRLQSFFTPMVRMLIQCVQKMDQKEFNNIIIAQNSELSGERDMLRNRVTIIAGVLRRCKTSPYLLESCTTLAPFILRFMEFIHNIRADELPPAYACIVEMSHDSREQFLPGMSRKSVTRLNGQQKTRNILMDMRMSLYQIIGALGKFLPADTFREMLKTMTLSAKLLPMHVMRSLITHCLFPLGIAHPALIEEILSACSSFFSNRTNRTSERLEDDIVDLKQLFYMSKDTFNFIRQHIVEKNLLENNAVLVCLVVEVALGILESGSNVHDASRFIITTLDSARKNCGVAVSAGMQMDDLAAFAFGRILDFLFSSDDAMLPHRDRERLVNFISDTYVVSYPLYTTALSSRFPKEQIDDLHTQLTVSQRFDIKRRRFNEFLSKAGTNTMSAS